MKADLDPYKKKKLLVEGVIDKHLPPTFMFVSLLVGEEINGSFFPHFIYFWIGVDIFTKANTTTYTAFNNSQ